jgi:hypothetical protein
MFSKFKELLECRRSPRIAGRRIDEKSAPKPATSFHADRQDESTEDESAEETVIHRTGGPSHSIQVSLPDHIRQL